MAVMCVVDEKGKSVFTLSDIKLLGKKSASALDKIYDIGVKLAGLKKEEIDEEIENFTDQKPEDLSSS